MFTMITSPPLFSKREKYSLALFSFGFVAFSCLVHFLAGSAGSSFMPRFTVEQTPAPQKLYLIQLPKHTPTPTPHPTSTPPPAKVTPQRVQAVHPPKYPPHTSRTVGPTEAPYT